MSHSWHRASLPARPEVASTVYTGDTDWVLHVPETSLDPMDTGIAIDVDGMSVLQY